MLGESQDELLWAATWLYIATRKPKYLKYIQEESISASVAEFSWDLKYAGAQILLSKVPYLQSQLLHLDFCTPHQFLFLFFNNSLFFCGVKCSFILKGRRV